MRKIIHYINCYLPLTATWIYTQIKLLKNYYPIVYTRYTQNIEHFSLKNNQIRSLELKRNNILQPRTLINYFYFSLFNIYPSFLRYAKKDNPKLIHAHFGPNGYAILKLSKKLILPQITTFYGYDLSQLPHIEPKWKAKYSDLFDQTDLFLVEGHHMKQCLNNLGCPNKKIIVQHLGIDLCKIRYQERSIDPSKNQIKILISASFREKKGIPYAIEAFSNVKKLHPDINLKLSIIGDSTGQPREEQEKRKILENINKFHLNDHVTLLGYQPYSFFINELYNHHIFLQPSIHASDGDTEGGAPVSLIEASASGMPIVATNHCDIPEVVLNNKNGLLAPEKDIDELTDKLEHMVLNSEKWGEFGKYGRAHTENNYNLMVQVMKLEEIYNKLVG